MHPKTYHEPMPGIPTAQKTEITNWKKNTKKNAMKLKELSDLEQDINFYIIKRIKKSF